MCRRSLGCTMGSLIPYVYKESNQSFLCTGLPLHYFLLLSSADVPPFIQERKFRQESEGFQFSLFFLSSNLATFPLGNLHCRPQLKQVYTVKLGRGTGERVNMILPSQSGMVRSHSNGTEPYRITIMTQ